MFLTLPDPSINLEDMVKITEKYASPLELVNLGLTNDHPLSILYKATFEYNILNK